VSVIYLVLPLATLVVLVAVGAFVWAARRGQFDDLITPAVRMLHDDADAPGPPAASTNAPPAGDEREAAPRASALATPAASEPEATPGAR
jgi:cbb3-type cytochrome oxidase maturation protein